MSPVHYALSFSDYSESGDEPPKLPPRGWFLSVPEIMEIRRYYDPLREGRENPWSTPYLTSSTEYRGLTPGGNDVIVVHHPKVGEPLPDPAAMTAATFEVLLDGGYGEVAVFDTKRALQVRPDGGDSWALIYARLGGEDLAHAVIKQVERRTGVVSGRSMFDYADGLSHPNVTHLPRGTELSAEKPAGVSLHLTELGLIRFNGAIRLMDLRVRDRLLRRSIHRSRVALAISARPPTAIAPPVRVDDLFGDHDRIGWRADGKPVRCPARLWTFDGRIMTDVGATETVSAGGTSWPGNSVTSFVPIGDPIPVASEDEIGKASGNPPPGANAYLVTGRLSKIEAMQYGHAVIDKTVRMPSREELRADWAVKTEIAILHAERWWRNRSEVAAA